MARSSIITTLSATVPRTGENSDKVELHYFRNGDPGAFVSVSGAGVITSSKHKDQAEAFVRWMAGKGGQAVLRDGDSYEYAIGNGALVERQARAAREAAGPPRSACRRSTAARSPTS